MSVGLPLQASLTYAVMVHLGFFVPITLWGFGILFMYGFTLQRTLTLAGSAASPAPNELQRRDILPVGQSRLLGHSRYAEPAEKPTAFMAALVAATLPLDDYKLIGAEREEAVCQVTAFVDGQLRALPLRLVVMFKVGMAGFRTITWLRHVRGFVALPPEEQKRWVELWAYGPVALARQLLRAVRATAVLAFYELPQVQAQIEGPPSTILVGQLAAPRDGSS